MTVARAEELFLLRRFDEALAVVDGVLAQSCGGAWPASADRADPALTRCIVLKTQVLFEQSGLPAAEAFIKECYGPVGNVPKDLVTLWVGLQLDREQYEGAQELLSEFLRQCKTLDGNALADMYELLVFHVLVPLKDFRTAASLLETAGGLPHERKSAFMSQLGTLELECTAAAAEAAATAAAAVSTPRSLHSRANSEANLAALDLEGEGDFDAEQTGGDGAEAEAEAEQLGAERRASKRRLVKKKAAANSKAVVYAVVFAIWLLGTSLGAYVAFSKLDQLRGSFFNALFLMGRSNMAPQAPPPRR